MWLTWRLRQAHIQTSPQVPTTEQSTYKSAPFARTNPLFAFKKATFFVANMSALDTEPGTELFASHEADFRMVQADITQKLDEIPELVGEQRKVTIRAAERAVDEADEIVCQHY